MIYTVYIPKGDLMVTWQLQEARQRFSEVVRRALEDGPQVVTRHRQEAVVVVSIAEFRRLEGGGRDFKEFLRGAPDLDRLKISRDRRPARRVSL
jgi:prevent-host-death family protein